MGTDIHFFVEAYADGKWHSVDKWLMPNKHDDFIRVPMDKCYYINRNYYLFGYLAGLRCELEDALALPRGLPPGLSHEVLTCYLDWESNAHSESYYLLSELLSVTKKLERRCNYFVEVTLEKMKEINPEKYGSGQVAEESNMRKEDRIRCVFWFDS